MSISKKVNKHGLGRGFESLIPTDLLDESFDPTASQDQQISDLRQIKLSQIVADTDQPRQKFDDESIAELTASIREHGVLQPIIVSPYMGGYQIVAGERRFRAAKMAKLDKIPALVRTLTGQHKLEISLIENLQREDLNIMETATAYLKLRDQFNMSLDEIGKRVGNKSNSAISNTLRLLKLPNVVRELLAGGVITEGQAKPLIGLDEDVIKNVLNRIVKEGWSSRKVEQYVVNIKKFQEQGGKLVSSKIIEQPYKEQLNQIKKRLNTEIKIHTNVRGEGYIRINFKNEKEFERLRKYIS